MMRLCTVVFPESSSSRTKKCTFKIPKMPYVREGDILRNPNYGDAPMKVVRVFDYPVGIYNTYNEFILKELLPIDTQVETPSTRFNNHQTSNNREKRNVKVSLEEARNWYNGKDQTLHKLALQAYTEKELSEPQSLKEVLESLGITSLHLNMKLGSKDASSTMKLSKEIGVEIGSELTLHMKLALIAKYFNGTWEPDVTKTKYFLAKTHYSYNLPNSIKLDNNYCIGTHERVMYLGIVYFQKQEDVKKAYEMLKAEG
jgi:hypothetical protein|nr:MAG TPA: hypothetical protein [Crassvirales sp.]